MSMQSFTIEGFGIDEYTIAEPTLEKEIAFLKKYLPDVYDKIEDYLINDINIDYTNTSEYIDAWEYEINNTEGEDGNCGFGSLLAEVINNCEKDFNVSYLSSEYGSAIVLVDSAPWEYTERERSMTHEDVKAVFAKYLNELGIDEFDIVRQSVEYYG